MEDKIALKSGYYFMIFKRDDIPFFDELEKTTQSVLYNDTEYRIYEAPNWEAAKKVDEFMGDEELGLEIDVFKLIPNNQEINI